MHQVKHVVLAAALLTASAAFAQTGMTRGMESSPVTGTTMPDAMGPTTNMNDTQMNDADRVNRDARAPAAVNAGGSYDSRMPADRNSMSGASGTEGTTASSNAGYRSRMGNQYDGASYDTLNGSGHYADTAHGSQLEANNYHATPQPGALNNQLYRGN